MIFYIQYDVIAVKNKQCNQNSLIINLACHLSSRYCSAMPLRSRGLSNRTVKLQVEIVSQLPVNPETICFLWGHMGYIACRWVGSCWWHITATLLQKNRENLCCNTLLTSGPLKNRSGVLATSPFNTRPLTDVGRWCASTQEMRPTVVATEELRSRNDYETWVKASRGGHRSHF